MKLQIELTYPQAPDDVSALTQLLQRAEIGSIRSLVIFGKTDGAATPEDKTRHVAQLAASAVIDQVGGADLRRRTWQIFSTGCEGIATPICLSIAATEAMGEIPSVPAEGMVIGAARSATIPDAKRCTRDHVLVAANCVAQAMASAGISASEVSLILLKSPVRFQHGGIGGQHSGSTGASRGAAALGSAIALGEVSAESLASDPILACSAFASRTMAFSGTESDCVEAIVFGTRKGGDPDWAITQVLLKDFLDVESTSLMKRPAGFDPLLVLFKAGIAADGMLRGRRTTIFSGDLPPDKHLRAAASGFIGALFGSADSFISGGAEHQGPDGSCLCSVIWRRAAGSLAKDSN